MNEQNLSIPDFSNAAVLVVGDVMLDRYWYGSTSRISPEAPVPVVHVNDMEERPGGAGNVALNISALNAGVSLVGVVGDDDAADNLRALLQVHNVHCQFFVMQGRSTSTKLRVVSRHQQLIRLDFEEQDGAGGVPPIEQHLLEQNRAVVLSDYGKGALNRIPDIIAQARKVNIPVLIDPKGQDFSSYRGATLITPNLSEFEAVAGVCNDLEELVRKGRQMCTDLELEAVLITRSEHGMTLVSADAEPVHLSARARDVFDVTGAGDTVIGVMAAALAAGYSLEQGMQLANIAAGLVVAKLGTASVSVEEIQAAQAQEEFHAGGILNESELQQRMQVARQQGKRVVMTNGCFDILHAGHVRYLNQARALGDYLIVAVNDDNSVQRLKGHGRPVNPLSRRMTVLEALGCVDWVVPFSEDTPERLISGILPDILVKGGDYRPEDIAGGKQVQANGGEVRVLTYEDGCSTSDILDSLSRSAEEEGVENP